MFLFSATPTLKERPANGSYSESLAPVREAFIDEVDVLELPLLLLAKGGTSKEDCIGGVAVVFVVAVFVRVLGDDVEDDTGFELSVSVDAIIVCGTCYIYKTVSVMLQLFFFFFSSLFWILLVKKIDNFFLHTKLFSIAYSDIALVRVVCFYSLIL